MMDRAHHPSICRHKFTVNCLLVCGGGAICRISEVSLSPGAAALALLGSASQSYIQAL